MSFKKVKNYLAYKCLGKKLRLNKSEFYISFTFDDFPLSAASTANQILLAYNIRATYYTAIGILGKQCYEKEMAHKDQLQRLIEQGHEIGCHTYYHTVFNEASQEEVKDSIALNSKEIKNIYNGYSFSSFSYPKGKVTLRGKRLIGKQFNTARSTLRGLNTHEVDLNYLKANRLYSDSVELDNNYELIDEGRNKGGWLIFYTHDVENKPSNFGCTPFYFEQVLKYSMKSGAKVLPVDEVENIISK